MDLPRATRDLDTASHVAQTWFIGGVVDWVSAGIIWANLLAEKLSPRIPGTEIQQLRSCACGGVSDYVLL